MLMSRLDAYISRNGDFCANDDDTTDYFTHCACARGNYSMYGQKSVNGEQFYEGLPRQYIEVTDEVYCERSLFELYCLLRYVQE